MIGALSVVAKDRGFSFGLAGKAGLDDLGKGMFANRVKRESFG